LDIDFGCAVVITGEVFSVLVGGVAWVARVARVAGQCIITVLVIELIADDRSLALRTTI